MLGGSHSGVTMRFPVLSNFACLPSRAGGSPFFTRNFLVTSYTGTGPGSDWSYYKPKHAGDKPGSVGPGTVAVANTTPPPYPYGTQVKVFDAQGSVAYH